MTFQREKPTPRETVNPKKLLEFMMTRWKPQGGALPPPLPNAQTFARRRRLLSREFKGQVLVIPTGHEKVRANDTVYRFRPGSDFFWLTGNLEPDCVLALVPKGNGHEAHLFVEPNPGRKDKTFFTDRHKGELWVGPRLGVEQSRARYGVEVCAPLSELKAFLKKRRAARVVRGLSDVVDRLAPRRPKKDTRDAGLAATLSELRLQKDALEIEELEAAVESTRKGFEDVIRALPAIRSEREVEGRFNLRARVDGNDVGYGTIAAAGAHACILHWTHNDGAVKKGDLLLLDAGVEGRSLYTADITRTLPVSGRFTEAQREIYTLVWKAQAAAMKQVRPGAEYLAPHRAAMRVLARGLEAMGILASADDALKDEHQFYKRYTLHGTSHMLGLDVHDCAKAREELYRYGVLLEGMVLTVEPGLYFQVDDLTVPARYRGIGVRIEDDVLVTKTGFRNLSASIPSEPRAVEKWMARTRGSKTTLSG